MDGPDPRARCVRCGGIVDERGAADGYCRCVCRWPSYVLRADGRLAAPAGEPSSPMPGDHDVRGCGARIYFVVNANERTQPFELVGGRPHHGFCRAFKELKAAERAAERGPQEIPCARCGKLKGRRGPCGGCGWRPGQEPKPAVDLERFM